MSINQIPPEDIQGDILDRLPKDCEHFLLFSIKDAAKFRESLRGLLAPDKGIGSAADVKDVRNKFSKWNKADGRIEHSFYNIGFSKDGIDLLGLKHEDLNDEHFNKGQLEDAKILGDPMVRKSGQELPDWEDEFLKVALDEQNPIHGIILVAGNEKNVKEHSAEIRKALEEQGATSIVYFLEGAVLPGERRKNEHFGWRDGISQPFVEGYTTDKYQTGQTKIPPGVLIVGAKGDLRASSRPEWAKGGSFMVFRKLRQFVPEFKQFLVDVAIKEGVIGHENQANAAKLLGSRLFGRWPSGTPLEKQPAEDRGVPEDELNSFDYKKVKSPNCPFAAHIRKTNPRNDLRENLTVNSSIVRAGIPYGEEIKEDSQEKRENRTIIDRGLAFVAYQSIIKEGFIEQQKQWANNPDFPPTPFHEIVPGFDGIIGQNNKPGDARARNGIGGLEIPKDFVHPRAGCYFFVPSIPALHEYFSG